jgi:hypothetical protein
METMNRLLPGLEHRPTELGRIRLGDKTEKGLPTKIETWRLTSASRPLLDAAAVLYGGTVTAWDDAPAEGYWELLTDTHSLQILIPRDLRTLDQWFEWWQGGTCERRCDGTTEQLSGLPCVCKSEGTMECRPRTRLNIMLPDVPGLGVWRLETDGWNASRSLPPTIDMLLSLSVQPWVKAVLRLEQRTAKKRQPDGKVMTHRFAVPVLDTPNELTLGRIIGQRLRQEIPAETQEPPTARERLAQQRAELEATTSGRGATPVGPGGADAVPLRAEAASQEPSLPADIPADIEVFGLSEGSVRALAPSPATHAGAYADTSHGRTPDDDSGGTDPDAGEPTPATLDAALAGAPLGDPITDPPPPAGATRMCGHNGGQLGTCSRAPGHKGKHSNEDASWPQDKR